MKQLIINGDDLGAAEGTVEAISNLYEAGILTSTTALVNHPDWPQAAAYLREHPGLGAGVHLVMNNGQPILPGRQVPSLVDEHGYFRDGNALLKRYGRLRTKELKAEWRAQIEKFIADTGRQPDHLDLHCHYPYMIPSWFRASLVVAEEYGHLPVRMPFDDALNDKVQGMAAGSGFPIWYVRWAGRRYQRMVRSYGLERCDFCELSFSLNAPDDHRTAEYLLRLLDTLPDGSSELVSHPGIGVDWREKDYRALLDLRVRKRITELDIQLVTYRELALGCAKTEPVQPA